MLPAIKELVMIQPIKIMTSAKEIPTCRRSYYKSNGEKVPLLDIENGPSGQAGTLTKTNISLNKCSKDIITNGKKTNGGC